MASLILKDRSGRELRVALPEGKGIILQISYTSEKFARSLEKSGVPLIEDTSPEETVQKQLVKKAAIAFRHGGGSPRLFLAEGGRSTIEGMGRGPIPIPPRTSVNGKEVLETLLEIARRRNINTLYLRTRYRATEVGLGRVQPKERRKFVTKLYLLKNVWFPDKRGTKPVTSDEVVGFLADFLDATWLLYLWDNPDSFVISITNKQSAIPTHNVTVQ